MASAGNLATATLSTFERLAAADPDNPEYQRDVSVAAYKIASVLESVPDPSALDYWAKAHEMLTALDAVGKLADADRQLLDYVTQKIGGHGARL